MGDDCCNPDSMGRVSDLIRDRLDGAFVYSVQVGNSVDDDHKAGFFGRIDQQVDLVCEKLGQIPELQDGFNAIGFSQVFSLLLLILPSSLSIHLFISYTLYIQGGLFLRY